MRKSFFIIFSMLFIHVVVKGQNEPQVSQYMFCPECYNPSAIVGNSGISLTSSMRAQWVGIPNAPRTGFYFANLPLGTFLKKKQSVGIAFVSDKSGLFSNESVILQYALRFKLGDGLLNAGVNIGFVSQTFAGDSVRTMQNEYHDTGGDTSIPKQSVSDVAGDVGIGAQYKTKNYYVGASILHLFEPSLELDEYVRSYIGRVAFLSGGYNIPLQNTRYVLKPSVLAKSNFSSFQTDLSARIEKDEKYWLGMSWRLQDAVVFFGGLNFMNGLVIGYSYDLSTNRIIAYSYGSHELMLRYNINLAKNKLNKYKSVRVL